MSLNKQKGNMYPFVTHTWNTVKGKCLHGCIYCYMLVYNLNPMRFDATELKTNLGSGKYIFVGSSCDMWAKGVPEEWIKKTVEHIMKFPNNTYLFQTKNPERWTRYTGFPPYVILGVTIETNRDYKISKAPSPDERVNDFLLIDHPRKMVSIEPIMDFDVDVMVQWIRDIKPEFVSVGADSKGHGLHEPSAEKIQELITELDRFTHVKVKNNLKRLSFNRGKNMKLLIRHEYFEQIKAGEKKHEYRDAHITFIDEKTGESLTKYIKDVRLILESFAPEEFRGKGLFDDSKVLDFELY